MPAPKLKENGLTYVWDTNAPRGHVTQHGRQVKYAVHLTPRDILGVTEYTYSDAVIGRPSGREDDGGCSNASTIAEMEEKGLVGIYTSRRCKETSKELKPSRLSF